MTGSLGQAVLSKVAGSIIVFTRPRLYRGCYGTAFLTPVK
jgi:hypothetical protein